MEAVMRNGDNPLADLSQRAEPVWGFTIIELLVVMAVLAILTAVVLPRYVDKVEVARETALKQNLHGLRTAIDQFYRDQSRYPESIDELVSKRYIRAIPIDPMTEQANTWAVTPPREGGNGVFDVRSGSPRKARDGSAYASW